MNLFQITDVSCGYGFTAYVINDKNLDSLYGTGINTYGQIGESQIYMYLF